MRWLTLALVAMAMVAAAYAWIARMPSKEAHRFRLIIEADTPGGLQTGSSVVQVERKEGRWPVPGPRYVFRVWGEAVFLDFGGWRNLVAIFAHGDNAEDADQVITLWIEADGHHR